MLHEVSYPLYSSLEIQEISKSLEIHRQNPPSVVSRAAPGFLQIPSRRSLERELQRPCIGWSSFSSQTNMVGPTLNYTAADGAYASWLGKDAVHERCHIDPWTSMSLAYPGKMDIKFSEQSKSLFNMHSFLCTTCFLTVISIQVWWRLWTSLSSHQLNFWSSMSGPQLIQFL